MRGALKLNRSNIIIYCDGSYDSNKHIGTWGCKMFYKNKIYDYNGICANVTDIHECELKAIVKALGKAKSFNVKTVNIYTDRLILSSMFALFKHNNKKVPSSVRYRNLWFVIFDYFKIIPNINISWIKRNNNLSHNLAFTKLQESRLTTV